MATATPVGPGAALEPGLKRGSCWESLELPPPAKTPSPEPFKAQGIGPALLLKQERRHRLSTPSFLQLFSFC